MYSQAKRDSNFSSDIHPPALRRIRDGHGFNLQRIGLKYIRQKSQTEEIKPGVFYPFFLIEDREGVALSVCGVMSLRGEYTIKSIKLNDSEPEPEKEEHRNGRNRLLDKVISWF